MRIYGASANVRNRCLRTRLHCNFKMVFEATATAPVNIATLKYWGKRDTQLNLPTNSSISVTLSQDDLRATTTARCDASFGPNDAIWLNGRPEDLSARTIQVLKELKRLRSELEAQNPDLPKVSAWKLHITSENNFPTAAGLASSAAGFAALVKAVALLYQLPNTPTELSVLARQGSGSACRSLFGGYVAWEMGQKNDGTDSQALQIAPATHWPSMRALILVASAAKKDVSSTKGMQVTVATSSLFQKRVREVVPQRFKEMSQAIMDRDFAQFAQLTMRDSNSFHAVCLDSDPPILYMNDISRACIRRVEEINEAAGSVVAAYTFDAGPNCVVYYLAENESKVLNGFSFLSGVPGFPVNDSHKDHAESRYAPVLKEGIERIIATKVGPGPQQLDEHLPMPGA